MKIKIIFSALLAVLAMFFLTTTSTLADCGSTRGSCTGNFNGSSDYPWEFEEGSLSQSGNVWHWNCVVEDDETGDVLRRETCTLEETSDDSDGGAEDNTDDGNTTGICGMNVNECIFPATLEQGSQNCEGDTCTWVCNTGTGLEQCSAPNPNNNGDSDGGTAGRTGGTSDNTNDAGNTTGGGAGGAGGGAGDAGGTGGGATRPKCGEGFEEIAGVCFPSHTNLPDNNDDNPITSVAITVMNWLLSIVGVVAIISFIVAGLIYLTSAGDDDRIQQAKRAMTWSVVGVIVALMGLVIVYAVDQMLRGSTVF